MVLTYYSKFAPVALVIVIVVSAVAEDNPNEPCTSDNYSGPKETFLHRAPNWDFRCCANIIIPKGCYALVCGKDNPDTTTWRACPEGKFQPEETLSVNMTKCKKHRYCEPLYGLKLAVAGTSVTDNICECDRSQGLYSKEFNPKYCYWQPCPPGSEVLKNGSCTECKYGMYNPENGTGVCRHWTQCKTKHWKLGNATQDSVCLDDVEEASITTATSSSSSSHPQAILIMRGLMSCVLTLVILLKGVCHMY